MSYVTPFKTLPRSYVPFCEILIPTIRQWLPQFLKWEKVQEQIQPVEAERKAILAAPPAKADYLKRLKILYDRASELRMQALTAHLVEYQSAGDPFHLENCHRQMGYPTHVSFQLPGWDEITEAVKRMPDDGITEAERERRLMRVDQTLAKLKAELEQLQPQSRYLLNDGRIIVDSWQEFVAHWRHLQSRLSGPAGPQGRTLESESDDLQWAHRQLGLDAYVNHTSSGQQPAAPPRGL